MRTIRLLLLFIAFNVPCNTFGQKECNLNTLIGEWKIISLIHWGVYTNVDSLRSLSQSHKTDEFITIDFNKDSTYTLRTTKNNKIRIGYFYSYEKKCELILNRSVKRLKNIKYRERSNWGILYIDNEILIYKEDNNPKNYATHVLLKK